MPTWPRKPASPPLPICPSADDAKLPTLCKADGSDPEPGTEAAREGPYWSLMFEVSDGYGPGDAGLTIE